MKLQSFFTSPAFSDEEGKKKLIISFEIILWVILFAMLFISGARFFSMQVLTYTDFILYFYVLLIICIIILLRIKKVFVSSIFFILITWLSMIAMAFVAAGIHDVTIIACIVVIFVSALIVGHRMALIISFMSICSIWVLAYFEVKGILIPDINHPFTFSRDFTVLLVVVTALIIMYNRSFKHSYNRINQELIERKKVEGKLRENEIMIKVQNDQYLALNEELTESNTRIMQINKELQVAKEMAEESDQLKTAFIQNISHEIRTPLNGIMGFTELLKSPGLPASKRDEYIQVIHNSCENLADLINDLIDISRIEAGIVDIHITRFDLRDLLKEVELFYSNIVKKKNLELIFENELVNHIIETDKRWLLQILNNLIDNSIKFTNSGFIKLKTTEQKGNLRISVIDSGIGIKKENFKKIFDRFTQAESGLTRSYGGTGLGLSIARGLIDHLGGEISVESEFGKGSEFIFSIPVKFCSEVQKEPDNKKSENKINGTNIKLLIAEDEDINFLYLQELLGKKNFTIFRAKNGLEAIELFKKHSDIDIVLMDIKMPEMNGYDASLNIKKLNPAIPVIAISAFVYRDEKQSAFKLAFDEFIAKPVTAENLFNIINHYLNLRLKN